MDIRRTVVGVLVTIAVVAIWFSVAMWVNKTYPPVAHQPPGPATSTAPSTTDTAVGPVEPTRPVATTQSPAATTQAPAGELRAVGGASHEPLVLGDDSLRLDGKSKYTVGLKLSPVGASVESVTMNRYRRQTGDNRPYVSQDVSSAEGGTLATDSVTIGDKKVDLSKIAWNVEKQSEDSATFSAQIVDSSGQPLVTLRKTYQIAPDDPKAPGQSYEILVSYSFEQARRDLKLQVAFNGCSSPEPANSRDAPEIVVGYNDNKAVTIAHWPVSGIKENSQNLAGKQPILWAGTSGAYFDAIALVQTQGQNPEPLVLAEAKAVIVNPSAEAAAKKGIIKLTTGPIDARPGALAGFDLRVFIGPKLRSILGSDYFASFPRSYDKTLVLTGGMCGFCTFDWLIKLLVQLLGALHTVLRDWGLAIIALVLIVRLLLHPITKRSQISMSRMSKMAPEMERLKKKYGDNKEELNKAMVELYKETGFAPFLGCLPMFLQMPIWIALWSSLQSTFELWQAPFLWGWTWIKDLSLPDRLIYFPNHPVNLWFFNLDSINLLPLLMAGVFWLQQKYTPKPPTSTPEQAQQQKMMQWMTLIFPLLLYTGPAGLNLYILTSTAIGIWESKRVRDHLKQHDEAERAGRVLIEAKPTRAGKRLQGDQQTQETPKGCLLGWMARMQQKAEEMRNEGDKKRPKR